MSTLPPIPAPRRTFWPLAVLLALLLVPGLLQAQLPPDSVDLSKVKIPEVETSVDLCPVHLEPSSVEGEAWEYDGVAYRGSVAGAKAEFLSAPEKYAAAAERERWIHNFMMAMSAIWCPVTDEVTPGGRKQVDALGYTWESCCSFCDEEMTEENIEDALKRLRERAEEAYELTGGVYVEDASSPVEGAIKDSF